MLKKLFSFVLLSVMFLGSLISVQAASLSQANLTILKDGATFSVYKVLDAKASNDVFVYDVNKDFKDFFKQGKYSFDKTKGIIKDGKVFLPVDKVNTTVSSKPTKVQPSQEMAEFTLALQTYMQEKNIVGNQVKDKEEKGLDLGCYLVLETANSQNNAIVASKAMMINLVKDMKIYPKDDQGCLVKSIVEDNKKIKKNDVGVGDKINYVVDSVVPTYDQSVKEIKYCFTDEFSKGLKYNQDLKVYLGEQLLKVNQDYSLKVTGSEKTKATLVIDIKNSQKLLSSVCKDMKLVYSATLTSDAYIDSGYGHPNEMKLEYTRGPNQSNTVLKDHTVTYTYGLKMIKKDGKHDGVNLAGAQFALFKKADLTKQIGKAISSKDGKVAFTTMDNQALGLDAGEYVIKEVKAPSGYSELGSDIYLTIKANNPLDGKATIKATNKEGQSIAEVKVITACNRKDQTLSIVNYKGISLPETGGSGTKVFMLIGGAFITLAAIIYAIYELRHQTEK